MIFEHAEARLTTAAEELYRAWKQEALGQGLWALDVVQVQGERLVGSGLGRAALWPATAAATAGERRPGRDDLAAP
ncbi:hypothetical protein ACFQU2_05415 [Siccirubricoccus deserti]